MDVAAVAAIGKKAHVPLMLDCTFNTLAAEADLAWRQYHHPFADKMDGGHGIAIGGAVVDGGNFDWGKDDRFPTIAGPHYAMNEINFFEEFALLPLPRNSAPRDV